MENWMTALVFECLALFGLLATARNGMATTLGTYMAIFWMVTAYHVMFHAQ